MVFIYIKIDGLMNVKDTGRNEKEEDHMPYVEIQDLEMYYEKMGTAARQCGFILCGEAPSNVRHRYDHRL